MGHKPVKLVSGQDFLKQATRKGAEVRCNGTSHHVVKYNGHSISVPVHGNEPIGKGLRHVLIKMFLAAGLLIFFGVILYTSMGHIL